MDSIIYNIPASMVEAYRGQRVIVRCHDSRELRGRFADADLQNLAGLQLLSLNSATDELVNWGYAIPIDLILTQPATDFPLLYQHSGLLATHPVRASIPVMPGFGKAVRLALSLNFAVKLEITQPDQTLIEEMAEVLDFYLHHPTVSQPVEGFHSLLFAFYHNDPVMLWTIQEEDPAYFRHIGEHGEETLSGRFTDAAATGDSGSFVETFQSELLADKSECVGCEFFPNCGGYFKWPRREYRCEGIKTLFSALRQAAEELRGDLAEVAASKGATPP